MLRYDNIEFLYLLALIPMLIIGIITMIMGIIIILIDLKNNFENKKNF